MFSCLKVPIISLHVLDPIYKMGANIVSKVWRINCNTQERQAQIDQGNLVITAGIGRNGALKNANDGKVKEMSQIEQM